MNKNFFLRVLALLLCAGPAFSQDYGLNLRSLPVLSNGDEPQEIEYTGTAIPWFAAPLGEQGDLYLSGGISAEYSDEEWRAVPELYRFGFSYRFNSGLRLEAGRLSYREPLNLVMNGLFDGLSLGFDLGKNRLNAGAFYTGLLYKKNARITMSPGDYGDYHDQDHYFASRRLVFVLGWEMPALLNTGGRLDLGITGQFDLNEPDDQIAGDGRIHSQYALAGLTLPFLNNFNTRLGALLGIAEEDDRDPGFFFAGSCGLAWLPPGSLNDQLSLGAAVSSGDWNDTARAFLPLNTIARGKILRPGLSGLALIEGGYSARLCQSLSADFQTAYFFRTDSRTYSDPGLDGDSLSPLLGGEIYGGLSWVPVSDVSFILGGGAFFPQWGKAFAADASARWRVSLETILSF
ncbi:MAG: hypothetical protein LBH26_02040 [Treponema sp.]|jgi:hypothetical protein|nr:hypothetical protein [Treponema sp.]